MIFVFGSNLAGIHGGGAADYAFKHEGAVWKQGKGLAGNSYALPTKGWKIQTLPLGLIQNYVFDFIQCVYQHKNLDFQVTRVGCGLAGYCDEQIAPLFTCGPGIKNLFLPLEWRWILGSLHYNYWEHEPGTGLVLPVPDWRK